MNSNTSKEHTEEFKKRAKELVAQMTLEEKVFQMLHDAPAIERLNIPAYNWWSEALHGVARAGVATMFPQAIGLAAAFDEDMMEQVGDAVSTEARAKFNAQQEFADYDIYKGLTMWAPNVNIFRDPRWGRGHETYGEDPYLTSRLGVRFVEGMQGKDSDYLKVAACAKHFAVHSGPEELRHEFNAEATKQDMYETYLPAFKALVQEAGVESVMGAYNRVNGEPCCGSKTLLTDILRNTWGFDGHVVSDCWAIKDFYKGHMVTSNEVESVALAVTNGCDINCGNIFIYLVQAVKEGKISEERVTESCERLFTTRMKLGLFDEKEKVQYNQIPFDVVDSKEMKELNLQVAKKTLVLLKNKDNILPLKKEKLKTIGVIGPNANNRKALEGNYEGTASRYVTILEGIQDYLEADDVRVLTSEGCHLHKDRTQALGRPNDRIAEVKEVCKLSDVVIACMGLDAGLEGEEGDEGNEFASGDKPGLNLPGLQGEVIKTIVESGKPTILILLSGSALAINWEDENVDAILQGWYPGGQGGRAIAETLFGECSPEGHLPVTFYRSTEELPEFTDYSMKNRTYRYMKNEALYPFGYGLSYTSFDISDISVSNECVDDGIYVECTVKNTGKMDGADVIQIYVKADRDNTPNPQLKAFKKIMLKAGEEKAVKLHLGAEAFSLCDTDGVRKVEPGNYILYVGESQPDKRSVELTGKKPAELVVCAKTSKIIE